MNPSIKVITGPAVEPVSVAEVKLQTHIDHSVEDDLIEIWIAAGRALAEDFLGRAFITQVLELTLDDFPECPFDLPMAAPLQSLMTIKYTDEDGTETTLYDSGYDPTASTTTTAAPFVPPTTNADFIIDMNATPGRVSLVSGVSWPGVTLQEMAGFKAQYAAGYGDNGLYVPAYIKNAILLYCSYCNENRSGEISEMPAHILNILRPNRVFG